MPTTKERQVGATRARPSPLYLALGILLGPRPPQVLSGNLLLPVLILLAMEALTQLFRIHFPAVPRRQPSDRSLWVYDTRGWFHLPNATAAVLHSGPDRGLVRISSLGLRGEEVERQRIAGVKRILVLGDSFVFGSGVNEEKLMTTHLQRFLDLGSPGGRRHQVVNLGVSGYATDQEYLLMEELGMTLFPDLVVLVMCDNDFQGNSEDFVYRRYYKPYFELDAQGKLVRRNNPVPLLDRAQRVKLFLGQESNLWNFVRSRKSEHPGVMSLVNWFQVALPRSTSMDPLEITAALVLALAERVEAVGAPLLVTNTGHRGEQTPLFHALRPKIRKPGIHVLGLVGNLGEVRRRYPDKLWDFTGDIHWNRDSHRLRFVERPARKMTFRPQQGPPKTSAPVIPGNWAA